MIEIKDIKAVETEMKRLSNALNALHVELIKEQQSTYSHVGLLPKQRGDVKRKSMDLTRALAEMRRP